jgi:hypothetical protein
MRMCETKVVEYDEMRGLNHFEYDVGLSCSTEKDLSTQKPISQVVVSESNNESEDENDSDYNPWENSGNSMH